MEVRVAITMENNSKRFIQNISRKERKERNTVQRKCSNETCLLTLIFGQQNLSKAEMAKHKGEPLGFCAFVNFAGSLKKALTL
jgi:hypothetical protein